MLNEADTRKIIDEQLRQVGWEADSDNLRYSRGTRPQKGRNIAVAEWQTDSGFVDYALFVGMKMIAVIEAKANYKDVPAIIDCQGKDYARNIRDEDKVYRLGDWNGFKVPFTFATNARPYNRQLETKSGIWFLDLRRSDNAPKALRGWISPTGIVELLERDISASNEKLQKLPLDFLRDEDGLNLRGYQIKAVQAAERAVLDGQKNILIAMATGTGKTRTVLGMIYRFLKAERFRRILFLVDRNSLGEQAQDVFATVKLEDLLPLDKIYNINKLGDKTFGKETRLQIATVQSMVKRILYAEDSIPGVSYNYTNTWQKIYGKGFPDVHPYFIHGQIHKHNLVFGIGETLLPTLENIYTECASFKKFFQRVKYRLGNDYKKISKNYYQYYKWQIIIYGHSLDATDKDSLRWLMGQEEKFDTELDTITIYYYDENSYNKQIANAIQIIGKKALMDAVHSDKLVFLPVKNSHKQI